MAKPKTVLIRMTRAVAGVGERNEFLEVERTDFLAGVIANGFAIEVADADVPAGATVRGREPIDEPEADDGNGPDETKAETPAQRRRRERAEANTDS